MVSTDRFYELLKVYGYKRSSWSDSAVRERQDDCCVVLRELPVLPFFLDLAKELNVPLDRIKVESSMDYGCPTCGGGGVDFEISWPRV